MEEKEYNYDKNGLLLPYILFVDLLSHGEFSCDYMDSIKQEFEEGGNKIDDHDNKEEINKVSCLNYTFVQYQKKKKFKKSIIYLAVF